MNKRIEIQMQPAFILHSWPYRNSSLLLDVFTYAYGRIGVIAHGVTRSNKSYLKASLQPFQPLLLSCTGHGELLTLQQADVRGVGLLLSGKALFCALYLNELLLRLLTRYDSFPGLFSVYEKSISELVTEENIETVLRRFEKQLLVELGYGLNFTLETHHNSIIEENSYYHYKKEEGCFFCVTHHAVSDSPLRASIFHGKNLLAIARDQLTDMVVLKDAKRLFRLALSHLLGDKPLKTRQIFAELNHFGGHNE